MIACAASESMNGVSCELGRLGVIVRVSRCGSPLLVVGEPLCWFGKREKLGDRVALPCDADRNFVTLAAISASIRS